MPEDRPNVLLVMTDQQRFDTINALGHEHVHTPNLDRLVERGVAYTNAYSPAPICVPARHVVRTGSDPCRTGYLGNDKRDAQHLEDTCGPFLARAMRERGYETFGVGKYHAHPDDIDLGYDLQLGGEDYARAVDADTSWDDGTVGAMNMLPQSCPLAPEDRRSAWIADRATAEIEDREGPFFGFVSFSNPHPRFNPSPPFDQLYDPDAVPDAIRENQALDMMDEKIPAQNHHWWKDRTDDTGAHTTRVARAYYYGLVTQLDREIGRVLDAVEAREDSENTLVVFASDHGEMLGDHHGWGKSSMFEQSARVPFLVSWPDELPADERRDDLVSLTDVLGICTTAAGDQDLRDGVDVLAGEGRERLFAVHQTPRKTSHFSIGPNFTMMAREDDWKYVWMANGGREQLFDVAADPRETSNLAEDRPEVVADLRTACVAHLQRHDSPHVENDALREHAYRQLDMGRYLPDTYPTDVGAVVDDA
jgi:choline-sulfatase